MRLLSTEITFKTLQPFETIEQLNANTKAIRDQFAHELSTAARKVLDVLNRYASKYYGVCYLSKNKIADMLGITRRTVIRVCNRLEEIGVIAQYEMDRTGGRGQTVNAIVFVTQISAREAFSADIEVVSDNVQEIGNVTGDVTPLNATNNAKKDLNTNDTEKESLLKNGLVTKLPKPLQRTLAPFFDADKLFELAGVVFKAKSSVDRNITLEENEQDYYNAILSVINAYKRGKIGNLQAVLYSAIRATTRGIWLRERTSLVFGL